MNTNYLSVAEVAERFRVSRMTVYRLMESGELGFVRVGRGYRIPLREFDQFVNDRTEASRRETVQVAS